MIKSGIPIAEAIGTLAEQTKAKVFQRVLVEVLKDIEGGQTLAESLKRQKDVFDQFYISMVEIGEESGTLEKNLEFLADQLAKDYDLRQKIRGAMLYPAIILITTAVMGTFITFFILPQLVDFFPSFQMELPLTTRMLLFAANFMKQYALLLGMIGIAAVIGVLLAFRIPIVKLSWHGILIKLPVFGEFTASSQFARFTRNLGTLLKSSVPISRSLETTANTLDNLAFRKALRSALEEVEKGKQLGEALESFQFSILNFHYPVFPAIIVKMIEIGEKTGKLEETLLYLSDFYEKEIDSFSKNLTTILEPVLLIGIGLVVGFVALAIISPIYQLTGSVNK